MLTAGMILTTAQEAEQTAINNIVIACGIDAALLGDWRSFGQRRFVAVALSTWERAQRERSALYYEFQLIQVFERGDYDAPPVEEEADCAHLARNLHVEPATNRNRLRVDAIETGIPRCLLKKPDHWPESASALRWIGSGGGAEVFGFCCGQNSPRCPGASGQR